MQQNIPVNILVGDRTYRVLVAPAEEERLRKTAKAINDQILDFKTRFAGKEMQDYLAMALLWHMSEPHPGELGNSETEAIRNQLAQIEAQLDGLATAPSEEG